MKNDARIAMLFQCLLDHTQQKLCFYLISLLRNNVSKSVYINLRHSEYFGRLYYKDDNYDFGNISVDLMTCHIDL